MPFLLATAANAVLYLHDGILTIALPIWIVSAKSIPNGMVSALLLVNTVGVILLQVRFARGTASIRGVGRAGLRSGLSLCAACVLLALSRETPGCRLFLVSEKGSKAAEANEGYCDLVLVDRYYSDEFGKALSSIACLGCDRIICNSEDDVERVADVCWIVGIGDLENIHYSRVSSAPMNL